jgi:hypothetical protein
MVAHSPTTLGSEVVEPDVSVNSFACASGTGDSEVHEAGDVISCSLTLSHTNASRNSAYSGVVGLILSEYLSFDVSSVAGSQQNISVVGSACGASVTVGGSVNNALHVEMREVLLSETVQVFFQLRIVDAAPLGELIEISESLVLNWTSALAYDGVRRDVRRLRRGLEQHPDGLAVCNSAAELHIADELCRGSE